MNFRKCLVKRHRTNYPFFQKKKKVDTYSPWLRKWLNFLFTSRLKAKKSTYLLNNGTSHVFEKFNRKFRINFREIVRTSANF